MSKKIKKYQKVFTGDHVLLDGEEYICTEGLKDSDREELMRRGKYNFIKFRAQFAKVEGKGMLSLENTELPQHDFKFVTGRPGRGRPKKPAEEKFIPFFTNLLPEQVRELKEMEEKYHRGQGEITREVIAIGLNTLKNQ